MQKKVYRRNNKAHEHLLEVLIKVRSNEQQRNKIRTSNRINMFIDGLVGGIKARARQIFYFRRYPGYSNISAEGRYTSATVSKTDTQVKCPLPHPRIYTYRGSND